MENFLDCLRKSLFVLGFLLFVAVATACASEPEDACELMPPVDPQSPDEFGWRVRFHRELQQQDAAAAELAMRFGLPGVDHRTEVAPASASADNATEKSAEPQRLGEAPPDDSRVFLRQSAVLLKPGTWEVEYGIRYTLQENAFLTVLPDTSIVPEFTDSRQVLGTLSIRYGLAERWQPFLTLPVGASFYERSNTIGEDLDDAYGLGDVLIGVNYLWRDGKNECADIITSFSVSAPTGPAAIGGLTTNQAALGSGFCTLSVSTTAVRSYDPLVLFVSLGYSHQFASEFQGLNVQPGELINGSFGLGFAVNDDFTLSTQLQTVVQLDFNIAGNRIPDTGLESSWLRHSVVHRVCEQDFVEFFVIHGVTDDAPRMSAGALRTHRY